MHNDDCYEKLEKLVDTCLQTTDELNAIKDTIAVHNKSNEQNRRLMQRIKQLEKKK